MRSPRVGGGDATLIFWVCSWGVMNQMPFWETPLMSARIDVLGDERMRGIKRGVSASLNTT